MADLLQKPCAEPGCKNLVRGRSRCPECAKKREAARGSAHKRGYGKGWSKTRASHLAQEPLCSLCLLDGKTVEAVEVDHIIPKAEDGTDAPENLQSLCKSCHSAKTAAANLNPVFQLEVEVVCGPPGSGREEYIAARMKQGELYIDDEELLAALSGLPKYNPCDAVLPFVQAARTAALELARARVGSVPKVWVRTGGATAAQRAAVLGRVEATAITTRDATAEQCALRIRSDEWRSHLEEQLLAEGERWRVAHAREEK